VSTQGLNVFCSHWRGRADGCDNQGRYWMPPASSRGLRSDAPSSSQIIAQPPATFKSLNLSQSALVSHVAEHFNRRDISLPA
jgi:hypothetical protein